jgi:hypothetical protein
MKSAVDSIWAADTELMGSEEAVDGKGKRLKKVESC